ncbi:hypothetical protein [Nitrosovibrio sp. Nv6]|uniref:hypothetical protein n=1 Tax=Nitrosovibrio sp. Nv6 TaxID=1855340 RepID=UPI0008C87D1E|nr:hypothetical protein [Nitrosovibrio sp. Nv6]SEO77990.1 hypothetical protein SAMN05216316_1075 [Nitrosovibrio sp. Nv6]
MLKGSAGYNPILTYTWATRPNYSTSTAGTVINISDVGGEAGSFWKATSAGWIPLNGQVKLAGDQGSIAAPVATITGSTGALFNLSGGFGSLVIPAKMLIPGHSALRLRALFYRRGANATATATIYIGTTGTSADPRAYFLSLTATDLQQNRADAETVVATATTACTTAWLAPQQQTITAASDLTTNINTDAAMTVSIGVATASALDSFDLISYSVVLESI